MKKTIAALVLAGIFSLPAMAQPKQDGSPEERASKMTEQMTEKLELTADQKESVYSANLEMANSMKDDRKTAHEAHQAKMKEILTDEQFAKLEEMQKNRRKGGKHRRMESSDAKELEPAQD
ncbi:hypothetical protein [Owenweeksia hongkongensis]|uniref:hypothetical protein n=1 Tax=Owenweeksia hongkongensis TaxID=253245 RepID=UPI003A9129D1